jgi:anti-sigma factor RsiW
MEPEIKIQAYVDGELSVRERSKVEALLEKDPEARALCDALMAMQEVVTGNEPVMNLPESREFFWSKIERELTAGERITEAPKQTAAPWWMKFLVPFGAAFCLLAVLSVSTQKGNTTVSPELAVTEVETSGGFTVYAPEENMTIVWVDTGVN